MPSTVQPPKSVTVIQRDWLSANHIFLHARHQTTLIDSGYCTHADMTLQLLTQALNGGTLNTLVNTHLHSDHCGGNARIQQVYPRVNTLIPPGHFEAVKQWDTGKLTYQVTGQNCPRFCADEQLHDGKEYEWGGLRWTAYSAPGHDNEAMIFFCASEGVLISADALWEKGFGVIFPELANETGYRHASATLNLIEDLAPSLVIPGHGAMFTDLRSALKYARNRLEHFQSFPDKHARYASKVLVKFKLQEHGTISLHAFTAWGQTVPYLIGLHQALAGDQPFEHWFEQLLGELCQSGAMDIQGQQVINIA